MSPRCPFLTWIFVFKPQNMLAMNWLNHKSLRTWLAGLLVLVGLSHAAWAQKVWVSMYSDAFIGKVMANGEEYNADLLTAASKKFQLNAVVRLIDRTRNITVEVKITDRMGAAESQDMRVSKATALRFGLAAGQAIQLDAVATNIVVRGDDVISVIKPVVRGDEIADAPISAAPSSGSPRSANPDGTTGIAAYTVQVGVFATEEMTRDMQTRLKGSWVDRVDLNGSLRYRVNYGKFATKEEAQAAQVDLKRDGINGLVRAI